MSLMLARVHYTRCLSRRAKRPLHFSLKRRASSTMSLVLFTCNLISFMTRTHGITRRNVCMYNIRCSESPLRREFRATLGVPCSSFEWWSGFLTMTTVSHRSDRVRFYFSSLLCSYLFNTVHPYFYVCGVLSIWVGVPYMFVFNHILYDVALLISRFPSSVWPLPMSLSD